MSRRSGRRRGLTDVVGGHGDSRYVCEKWCQTPDVTGGGGRHEAGVAGVRSVDGTESMNNQHCKRSYLPRRKQVCRRVVTFCGGTNLLSTKDGLGEDRNFEVKGRNRRSRRVTVRQGPYPPRSYPRSVRNTRVSDEREEVRTCE